MESWNELNSGNKSPLKFEGTASGLALPVQEAELGGNAWQIEGLFSVVLANSQEERYRGSLQLAQDSIGTAYILRQYNMQTFFFPVYSISASLLYYCHQYLNIPRPLLFNNKKRNPI